MLSLIFPPFILKLLTPELIIFPNNPRRPVPLHCRANKEHITICFSSVRTVRKEAGTSKEIHISPWRLYIGIFWKVQFIITPKGLKLCC
jgi:hypothetical protein